MHRPATLRRSGPADPARAESGTRVNKELVIDINLETLRRGRVLSGETCQIRGVGPVPVEIARQWADDAFVKAVIRDGTDIKTVVHYGRHLPAEVRTALGVRDQHVCQVPGCSNPRIEYDHDRPHADHGPTSTTNLRALCVPHHRQRTHHGYELDGRTRRPPLDRPPRPRPLRRRPRQAHRRHGQSALNRKRRGHRGRPA